MLKKTLKNMSIFDGLLKVRGYKLHSRTIQFSDRYVGHYRISVNYVKGYDFKGYDVYWNGHGSHILYHSPAGTFHTLDA